MEINKERKSLEQKKVNYFKIVWLAGIMAILIYILAIVIKYKVYYEYTIGNIYFYNCNSNLCYTNNRDTVGENVIYSEYHYQKKIPEIKPLEKNYAIINENILYNYITGVTITDKYDDYIITDNNIIVILKNKYGIISKDGEELVSPNYIEMYTNDGEYFVVKEDKKSNYKLIDSNNNIILEDNDYIFEYNKVVISVKDMLLNIQDIEGNNLIEEQLEVYDKNKLVNVSIDDNTLYIKVYKSTKESENYSYNISNQELQKTS